MENFKGLKRYEDIVKENNETPEEVSSEEAKNADKRLSYEMVTREVSIPSTNKETYDKLIKKVTRYCKAIGFPVPTQKVKGEKFEYSIVNSDSGNVTFKSFDLEEFEERLAKSGLRKGVHGYKNSRGDDFHKAKFRYDVIDLTIVDEVKPLEDWVILGTIDYKDGILNPAPGKQIPNDLIPDKLYGTSYCTHCNSNRLRNKIVFIQNEDDGKIIQVGGSCIKYYLGYDYERILSLIETVSNLGKTEEVSDEYYGSFGGDFIEPEYSVKEIIKYYIYLVKSTKSHMSKKQAKAYNEKVPDGGKYKSSTSEHVNFMVVHVNEPPKKDRNDSGFDHEKQMKKWNEDVKEFDKNIKSVSDKEYKEIVDFVESKVKESNFMFNVSNKIKEGYVKGKFINYIAGACSYFFSVKFTEEAKAKAKEQRDKENAGAIANSKHIGTVGEKTAFEELTIKKIRGFETDFGWSNVYNLEDKTGNVFVKFGTINKKFVIDGGEVEEGAVVSFTADVKKHGEFNNIKQTTLGRLSKFNPDLKY